MNTINNEKDIQEEIERLEQEKALQKEALSEDFGQKLESLKPAALLRSAVDNVRNRPPVQKGVMIAVASIIAMILLKKIFSPAKRKRGIFFMAVSAVTTMLLKKAALNALQQIANNRHRRNMAMRISNGQQEPAVVTATY
jgi:hypothetical protein